jgi:hypothetical protein
MLKPEPVNPTHPPSHTPLVCARVRVSTHNSLAVNLHTHTHTHIHTHTHTHTLLSQRARSCAQRHTARKMR